MQVINPASYGRAEPSMSWSTSRGVPAARRWRLVSVDYGKAGYATTYTTVCLEAAYRLIESSPTLRREWFGR